MSNQRSADASRSEALTRESSSRDTKGQVWTLLLFKKCGTIEACSCPGDEPCEATSIDVVLLTTAKEQVEDLETEAYVANELLEEAEKVRDTALERVGELEALCRNLFPVEAVIWDSPRFLPLRAALDTDEGD